MKIVFIVIALLCSVISIAQTQEATTTEGKTVILYNDGTWEYKTEATEDVKIEPTSISNDVNAEGEMTEIYFSTSDRLDRFFGNPKNKIRGKAKCFIVNGQPKIEFMWETYLGDGNRYFGYLKEGTVVTLKLKDEKQVQLTLDENINTDAREKYHVTIFTGTANITNEQVALLVKYPVESIMVEWKKKPEEYKAENTNYFRSEFVKLLK